MELDTHRLYFREFNDCELVNITTPDEGFELLAEINNDVIPGDLSNVRDYTVTFSTNCCPSIVIRSHVYYEFAIELLTCNYETIGDLVTWTSRLTGINPAYVSSMVYYTSNSLVEYPLNYTIVGNTIEFTTTIPNPLSNIPFTFFIKVTHSSGFVYLLEYTIDYINDPCVNTTNLVINYPELDERLNIQVGLDGVHYLLVSDLYENVYPGVYQVIICRRYEVGSTCVQDSIFLECDLRCQIIHKLAQCRDSDIMFFYDALVMSNYCTNITYEDKCALYELLRLKLDTVGCYDPFKDCDCSDNYQGALYSTRQSNVRRTPNNCSGCTS